jgi:thiol-disulfide isomerase/thioredoxin
MTAKMILGFLVVLLITVGGGIYLTQSQNKAKEPVTAESEKTESESSSDTEFRGKVLAGKQAKYIEFNTRDFEKAKELDKIIFLDFYANWCPECRSEAPNLLQGFNNLNSDSVVGFRVNYKDSDTSEDEKNLAKDLGITYQHTKVILRNGQEVFRTQDTWSKSDLVNTLLQIN